MFLQNAFSYLIKYTTKIPVENHCMYCTITITKVCLISQTVSNYVVIFDIDIYYITVYVCANSQITLYISVFAIMFFLNCAIIAQF